jgi:hypothetical protein
LERLPRWRGRRRPPRRHCRRLALAHLRLVPLLARNRKHLGGISACADGMIRARHCAVRLYRWWRVRTSKHGKGCWEGNGYRWQEPGRAWAVPVCTRRWSTRGSGGFRWRGVCTARGARGDAFEWSVQRGRPRHHSGLQTGRARG